MQSEEREPFLTSPAWDDLSSMSERDKMADTAYNASAGRLLLRGRRLLGMKQAEMAVELASLLGLPVSQSALSGWENGTRSVPGAVLAAVLERCAVPIDELLDGSAAETSGALHRLAGDMASLSATVAGALETLAKPGSETPAQRAARLLAMAREIRSRFEDGGK